MLGKPESCQEVASLLKPLARCASFRTVVTIWKLRTKVSFKMDVTSSSTWYVFYIILAVSQLSNPSQADRAIRTSPSDETKAKYTGIAYVIEYNSQNLTIAKFLGIPYALPAVRFQKPILDTPKEEVFDATKLKDICPQIVSGSDTCIRNQGMSENCLFLNIYVPARSVSIDRPISSEEQTRSVSSTATETSTVANTRTLSSIISSSGYGETYNTSTAYPFNTTSIASETSSPKSEDVLLLPSANTNYGVLIYIHGGAYFEGSGNCYDGSILAGFGDIIVVTINYRLGNLGFLSTNDDVIPGNLGLWDQHMAIQWVKRHIHVFGGDPNRITVGGQSAGSYSSIFQALYAGNAGLFQRVIAQSGTPIAAKSASTTGYNSTLEVARRLQCSITGTKQEVKSCLMNKSATAIVNIRLPMLVPGSLPVQPTVEQPFVPEDPYLTLSMATTVPGKNTSAPLHFIEKDLLLGIDADDGDVIFRLNALLEAGSNATLYMQLLSTLIQPAAFKEFTRKYLQNSTNGVVDDILIESVLDRYVDWQSPEDLVSMSNRLIDMMTDVYFALPVLDTASAHIKSADNTGASLKPSSDQQDVSQNGSKNQNKLSGTYVYRFDVPVSVNQSIPWWFEGTGHASEVSYVFGVPKLRDESHMNLSKCVMAYWSNFVKHGNPNNPSGSEASNWPLPVWNEYNDQGEDYLELSVTPGSGKRLRASYRQFWTQYIPKLKYNLQKSFTDGVKSVQIVPCSEKSSNGQMYLHINSFMLVAFSYVTLALINML